MARSLFRRMVSGGAGPALMPPRPVANVWKSARIDSIAAPSSSAAPPVIQSGRRRAPAAVPETVPVASTPVETGRERRSVTSAQLKARPEIREIEAAVDVKAPVEKLPTVEPSPPECLPRPDPQIRSARKTELPVSAAPLAAITRQAPHYQSAPAIPPVQDAAPLETKTPASTEVPVRTTRPQEPSAVAGSPAKEPSITPEHRTANTAPPSRIETIATPIEPVRHRVPDGWMVAPRQEAHAPAKNAVHIGRIEVQVVSPPAPVRYAAPPSPPKGRLARGYALWPAWQ